MKLGTNEPKKLITLAVLVVVGGYVFYSNVLSSPDSGRAPTPAAPAPAVRQFPTDEPAPPLARPLPRPGGRRTQSDEFHPVLHPKRQEDRVDPAKVDPTLRLDLLAKLQKVEVSALGRNVFQLGPAPVKTPEPKVIPKPLPVAAMAAPPPGPVAPPPPPPIPLKYYGASSAPGTTAKTAFFLDGDEILFAKEGETLKRRYRVVRIGVSSVVMEDTESKHQQTLQLEEVAG